MASAVKTVATKKSVAKFLDSVENPERAEDCRAVVEMMRAITKSEPVMWGTSISRCSSRPLRPREGDAREAPGRQVNSLLEPAIR